MYDRVDRLARMARQLRRDVIDIAYKAQGRRIRGRRFRWRTS